MPRSRSTSRPPKRGRSQSATRKKTKRASSVKDKASSREKTEFLRKLDLPNMAMAMEQSLPEKLRPLFRQVKHWHEKVKSLESQGVPSTNEELKQAYALKYSALDKLLDDYKIRLEESTPTYRERTTVETPVQRVNGRPKDLVRDVEKMIQKKSKHGGRGVPQGDEEQYQFILEDLTKDNLYAAWFLKKFHMDTDDFKKWVRRHSKTERHDMFKKIEQQTELYRKTDEAEVIRDREKKEAKKLSAEEQRRIRTHRQPSVDPEARESRAVSITPAAGPAAPPPLPPPIPTVKVPPPAKPIHPSNAGMLAQNTMPRNDRSDREDGRLRRLIRIIGTTMNDLAVDSEKATRFGEWDALRDRWMRLNDEDLQHALANFEKHRRTYGYGPLAELRLEKFEPKYYQTTAEKIKYASLKNDTDEIWNEMNEARRAPRKPTTSEVYGRTRDHYLTLQTKLEEAVRALDQYGADSGYPILAEKYKKLVQENPFPLMAEWNVQAPPPEAPIPVDTLSKKALTERLRSWSAARDPLDIDHPIGWHPAPSKSRERDLQKRLIAMYKKYATPEQLAVLPQILEKFTSVAQLENILKRKWTPHLEPGSTAGKPIDLTISREPYVAPTPAFAAPTVPQPVVLSEPLKAKLVTTGTPPSAAFIASLKTMELKDLEHLVAIKDSAERKAVVALHNVTTPEEWEFQGFGTQDNFRRLLVNLYELKGEIEAMQNEIGARKSVPITALRHVGTTPLQPPTPPPPQARTVEQLEAEKQVAKMDKALKKHENDMNFNIATAVNIIQDPTHDPTNPKTVKRMTNLSTNYQFFRDEYERLMKERNKYAGTHQIPSVVPTKYLDFKDQVDASIQGYGVSTAQATPPVAPRPLSPPGRTPPTPQPTPKKKKKGMAGTAVPLTGGGQPAKHPMAPPPPSPTHVPPPKAPSSATPSQVIYDPTQVYAPSGTVVLDPMPVKPVYDKTKDSKYNATIASYGSLSGGSLKAEMEEIDRYIKYCGKLSVWAYSSRNTMRSNLEKEGKASSDALKEANDKWKPLIDAIGKRRDDATTKETELLQYRDNLLQTHESEFTDAHGGRWRAGGHYDHHRGRSRSRRQFGAAAKYYDDPYGPTFSSRHVPPNTNEGSVYYNSGYPMQYPSGPQERPAYGYPLPYAHASGPFDSLSGHSVNHTYGYQYPNYHYASSAGQYGKTKPPVMPPPTASPMPVGVKHRRKHYTTYSAINPMFKVGPANFPGMTEIGKRPTRGPEESSSSEDEDTTKDRTGYASNTGEEYMVRPTKSMDPDAWITDSMAPALGWISPEEHQLMSSLMPIITQDEDQDPHPVFNDLIQGWKNPDLELRAFHSGAKFRPSHERRAMKTAAILGAHALSKRPNHEMVHAMLQHVLQSQNGGNSLRHSLKRMHAAGFFGNAWNRVKNVASKIKTALTPAPNLGSRILQGVGGLAQKAGIYSPDWVASIPGEFPNHYPGHNFTGPGTKAEERIAMGIKPVNAVDAGSMAHDLAYNKLHREYDADHDLEKAHRATRAADIELLNTVLNLSPDQIPTDGSQAAVAASMRAKMLAEDKGLLDKGKFSLAAASFDNWRKIAHHLKSTDTLSKAEHRELKRVLSRRSRSGKFTPLKRHRSRSASHSTSRSRSRSASKEPTMKETGVLKPPPRDGRRGRSAKRVDLRSPSENSAAKRRRKRASTPAPPKVLRRGDDE
jgi:hypothetical protein